jgi:hypothetical protein
VQAPHLTLFEIMLDENEDDGAVFSWNVLEAAPAVTEIMIASDVNIPNNPHGGTVLQSISAVLRHGAMRNLEGFGLWNCTVDEEDVRDFMDALEKSGCAKRLGILTIYGCGVGVQVVSALADLLSRGVFPALKILDLGKNPNIMDVGVGALTEALLKPTQTFLKELRLTNVGMGEEGISALASLVGQGRLEQLNTLGISGNPALTQEGIVTLARAIDARGLPMLQTFSMKSLGETTAVGISAIAHALITGCPKLKEINLKGSGPENGGHHDAIRGMLAVAGRSGEVALF